MMSTQARQRHREICVIASSNIADHSTVSICEFVFARQKQRETNSHALNPNTRTPPLVGGVRVVHARK